MIQKLKIMIASLALIFSFGAPILVPAIAYGESNNITENLCTGTKDAAGGTARADCVVTGDNGNDSLKTVAGKIVNIFSIIVGITAIIMVIYGGFRYITSGGDSGKVGNAKNTLIYAIVGLIIVALAQFLVHYVLTTATNSV